MGRTKDNGLPMYLNLDKNGRFYLDYPEKIGTGVRRRREWLVPGTTKLRALAAAAEVTTRLNAIKRTGHDPGYSLGHCLNDYLAKKANAQQSIIADKPKVTLLLEILGDRPMADLNHDHAALIVARLKEKGPKGRPLKEASINRYTMLLKASTRHALLMNKVERDPMAGFRLLREDNIRDRVLEKWEYVALLAVAAPHLKPIIRLAYKVGMRLGEILGLEWDRVDLEKGLITLRKEDTKTRYSREVPLDEDLIAMFKSLPRSAETKTVFLYWRPEPDGSVPALLKLGERSEPTTIKTAFNNAVAKAGIEDFTFHDLRHCAVTNLVNAGADQATIMAITGHRTDAAFRRYKKTKLSDKKRALDQLDLMLGKDGPELSGQ